MSKELLPTLVLALVLVGGMVAWMTIPRRRRLAQVGVRQDLTLDQIYADFFSAKNLPKDLVFELWNEVANSLELPPGKLRPHDRFDKELAAPKGWEWDDELADVQWAGERRLKRMGIKCNLMQIQTLGDYVEYFCNLQRNDVP